MVRLLAAWCVQPTCRHDIRSPTRKSAIVRGIEPERQVSGEQDAGRAVELIGHGRPGFVARPDGMWLNFHELGLIGSRKIPLGSFCLD